MPHHIPLTVSNGEPTGYPKMKTLEKLNINFVEKYVCYLTYGKKRGLSALYFLALNPKLNKCVLTKFTERTKQINAMKDVRVCLVQVLAFIKYKKYYNVPL